MAVKGIRAAGADRWRSDSTSFLVFSHLFLLESNFSIWITHIVGMIILLLVAWGVAPRISTTAGFIIVLCYVHRAPMVTNQFEAILCMLFLYLSVGSLCVDFRDINALSWTSNVATRLIQVHLCGFYVLIATSKLGSPVWWTGEAAWYLITDVQHRLVDLAVLTSSPFLMNGITHLWLLTELLFPVLIWNRHTRPLMLLLVTISWIWTAFLTGLVAYSLLMFARKSGFRDARCGWRQKVGKPNGDDSFIIGWPRANRGIVVVRGLLTVVLFGYP